MLTNSITLSITTGNITFTNNIIIKIAIIYVIKTLMPLAFFLMNFLFDFSNPFSILDAGMYSKYANNPPVKNGAITSKNFPIACPIAVKLSKNLYTIIMAKANKK